MELQNFTDKVEKALLHYYGDEVKIGKHKVYKNNGLLLQGICVLEEGRNIAPTIYLNDFYQRYVSGETFGEIIKEIAAMLEKNQIIENVNVNFFMDYEKVRKKLVLRLIHKEKNEQLLQEVPYREFQDLAMVCQCLVETEEIGTGSILIYKHHLQLWGIEEDTLFEDTMTNSPLAEPFCILDMKDMVKSIMENVVKEQIDEICEEYPQDKEKMLERTMEQMACDMEEQKVPMYILTNSRRYYGAACLVYPMVPDTIAQILGEDFYVLPSSVHEIIFVAKSQIQNPIFLNEMIEEVNRTQVDDEEWLSHHAYLYESKHHKFISIF